MSQLEIEIRSLTVTKSEYINLESPFTEIFFRFYFFVIVDWHATFVPWQKKESAIDCVGSIYTFGWIQLIARDLFEKTLGVSGMNF